MDVDPRTVDGTPGLSADRSGESGDIAPRGTRTDETARYRAAAEHAIEQLDWVVRYLHEIRRHKLARALLRNRMAIVRRLNES